MQGLPPAPTNNILKRRAETILGLTNTLTTANERGPLTGDTIMNLIHRADQLIAELRFSIELLEEVKNLKLTKNQ